MTAKKFSEAMGEIDNKYIDEAIVYKKKSYRKIWIKWGAIASCICLLCVGGFFLLHIFQNASQPYKPPIQEEKFVLISSLLVEKNSDFVELIEENTFVPIGKYTGIYVKVASANSDTLSKSTGRTLKDTETWYYVSGHTDIQYLIHNDSDEYSLWKFRCFDSDEYPYSDVLELVYQIDSADKISEIKVNPATMDNTDYGKAVQEKIGTHTVTDGAEIEIMYQILSSLTCYGENQWDMIDYGDVEAAADEKKLFSDSVWLGRYLTFITSYGNEIDGLKYTAVSDMFYEYSGIAYGQLKKEQADGVCEILHIEKAAENESMSESENSSVQPADTFENGLIPTSENNNV